MSDWEDNFRDEDDHGPYYLVEYQDGGPPFERAKLVGPFETYDRAALVLKHALNDLMIVMESELVNVRK